MEKNISRGVTTTKPAAEKQGQHGKSMEPPAHHHVHQRRTVASDEEKKEREARVRALHKHAPPHPHKDVHHDKHM